MSHQPRARPDPAMALLDIYEVAVPEIYGYLLARCGARAVAEDLTAETFLAAVSAARREDARQPSVGWLIGIARHKLVDHWRRAEREQRGLRALADERAEPTTIGTSGSTCCWPGKSSPNLARITVRP